MMLEIDGIMLNRVEISRKWVVWIQSRTNSYVTILRLAPLLLDAVLGKRRSSG